MRMTSYPGRTVMLAASLLFVLTACSGSDGAAGATGPAGTGGPTGPQGPPGSPAPVPPGAGVNLQITAASVAATSTVTFTVADAAGRPIDLLAELAANTLAPKFTLAHLDATGKYVSYVSGTATGLPYTKTGASTETPPVLATATQAQSERPSASTPADVARFAAGTTPGTYTYTYKTAITAVPGDVNTAGIYFTRNYTDKDGKVTGYPAAATFDVVPTGKSARDVVTDAACNACHSQLQAHDRRRGVKLCLSCHNPGSTDPETGNTVDMAVMIHKLHGGNYTTNTYEIVGFRQTYFDFSNTRFAGPTGEAKECAACHTSTTPLKFSRAACGACHDTVDWTTHAGGQTDDFVCNSCHSSTTAKPGVQFVHSKLYSSAAAARFTDPQFVVTITGVTGGAPGANPVVAFTVSVGGAPFDLNADLAQVVPAGSTLVTNPRKVQSFRFSLAGPTTDFGLISTTNTTGDAPQSPSPQTGTTFTEVAVGSYTYTFPTLIPATAKGTYAIGFEGYFVQKLPATGTAVAAKSFAPIVPLAYFSVDGSTVAPRRAIVDDAKCNSCHGGLGFHGESSRKTVAYCAFCHNAFNVNDARNSRPEFFPGAATNTWTTTPWSIVPESVQLSTMVHRMHANLDLTAGQYVFGADRFVSAAKPLANLTTFKFEFPNYTGVQNCAACHLPGTWGLPASTNLPTRVQTWTCSEAASADANDYCTAPFYTATDAFVLPQAAMCVSCHDTDLTKNHAASMTFGTFETCGTCHGIGKEVDVFKVHQPRP